MLEVQGLETAYGPSQVLFGVSFRVGFRKFGAKLRGRPNPLASTDSRMVPRGTVGVSHRETDAVL